MDCAVVINKGLQASLVELSEDVRVLQLLVVQSSRVSSHIDLVFAAVGKPSMLAANLAGSVNAKLRIGDNVVSAHHFVQITANTVFKSQNMRDLLLAILHLDQWRQVLNGGSLQL